MSVLITVTGVDKPGVTSALFEVLSGHEVELLNVEQVVIRGRLTLGVLVSAALEEAEGNALRKELEAAIHAKGLDVTIERSEGFRSSGNRRRTPSSCWVDRSPPTRSARWPARWPHSVSTSTSSGCLGLPGHRLGAARLGATGRGGQLQAVLTRVAADQGIDIAVEDYSLERRAKRLIVFDVDSTLIQGEVIEMLAARAGAQDTVAAITEQAMRGELDFTASLQQRVAALAACPQKC
ncbi:phosphoserine phosphatase [Mycobacterium xenopi 3993]|nr:phosphoserine phosphatase [Mycobacterium xenopi 3993]